MHTHTRTHKQEQRAPRGQRLYISSSLTYKKTDKSKVIGNLNKMYDALLCVMEMGIVDRDAALTVTVSLVHTVFVTFKCARQF